MALSAKAGPEIVIDAIHAVMARQTGEPKRALPPNYAFGEMHFPEEGESIDDLPSYRYAVKHLTWGVTNPNFVGNLHHGIGKQNEVACVADVDCKIYGTDETECYYEFANLMRAADCTFVTSSQGTIYGLHSWQGTQATIYPNADSKSPIAKGFYAEFQVPVHYYEKQSNEYAPIVCLSGSINVTLTDNVSDSPVFLSDGEVLAGGVVHKVQKSEFFLAQPLISEWDKDTELLG